MKTQNHIHQTKILLVVASSLLMAHPIAHANSVYVGYSQSEQTSVIGEREFSLDPSGMSVLASFDLSDNWVLSLDVGNQDDSGRVDQLLHANSESDSWGASLNYYWDNWVFTYGYSNWEDELVVVADRPRDNVPPVEVYRQTNDSPSHALRAGYYWMGDDWQLGLTGGLHISSWEQYTKGDNPTDNFPPQDALDEGDTTFISVGLNGAKFFNFVGDQDMVLGGSVSWNELTNDDSTAVVRNGRNVNQITNRNAVNRLNATVVSGSDSYGQLNVYLSWEITENWVADVDTGIDFGSDDNSHFWSLNVGYVF